MKSTKKELYNLLLDIKNALNCSPATPWRNCKSQTYGNSDHYDSHVYEILKIINKYFDEIK